MILLFYVAKEALGNLKTTCSKSRDLIGFRTQITCFQIVCSRPSVAFHPGAYFHECALNKLFSDSVSASRRFPQNKTWARVSELQLATRLLLYAVKQDYFLTMGFVQDRDLSRSRTKILSNFSVVQSAYNQTLSHTNYSQGKLAPSKSGIVM